MARGREPLLEVAYNSLIKVIDLIFYVFIIFCYIFLFLFHCKKPCFDHYYDKVSLRINITELINQLICVFPFPSQKKVNQPLTAVLCGFLYFRKGIASAETVGATTLRNNTTLPMKFSVLVHIISQKMM